MRRKRIPALWALLLAALLCPAALGEAEPSAERLAGTPFDEAPVAAEPEDDAVAQAEVSLDDLPQPDGETDAGFLDLGDDDAPALTDEDDDPELFFWSSAPLADSDALFGGYVRRLFGAEPLLIFEARNVGGDLTGAKRTLYNALSARVVEVAAGSRASTEFVFDNGGNLTRDDVIDVLCCVVADHPYDLYWYANYITMGFSGHHLYLRMGVGNAYADGEYAVSSAAVSRAVAAAENARAIVKKYAYLSDYEKLVAYRNEICDAVTYNNAAASGAWSSLDNDPWQLIWVFDGDPSTNVVCEGYAKAFQCLCDMTSFTGSVVCYSVTGYCDGGAHEWNIVRMPNGKNYHVDITFCDDDEGFYDWTFMKAPAGGSVYGGYYFYITNSRGYMTCSYAYSDETKHVFSLDDLTLSESSFLDEVSVVAVQPRAWNTTELSLGDDSGSAPAAAVPATPVIAAVKKSGKATVVAAPGSVYQLDLGGATGRKFKSSNKKVATVNGAGLVTIRKAGKTKLSFKVGKKTRKVTLTVKDPTVPTAVFLNLSGTQPAQVGVPQALTVTVPEGTYSGIKWKSSNKKVATVSNGVVTFKKAGKVTITATASRGKKKAKVKFVVSY